MKQGNKIKVNNYKCKSCASELKFDLKSQNLVCASCGSEAKFEKNSDIEKHDANITVDNSAYKEWINQSKFLKCDSCGAKVVLGKYDISKNCPYCGSSFVVQIDELPGLKPDAVVPFDFDEKEAGLIFKTNVKKKFFVPKNFKEQLPESRIHGIYVPVFVFNAKTRSSYSGKVDVDEDSTRHVSGEIDVEHENVLVESSNHLTDLDIIQLQPFDLNKSFRFDRGFVNGYVVEHYQETIDHCKNIARNKFRSQIEDKINSNYWTYGKVKDLEIYTNYVEENYSYHLIPVYNLEYKYKGKNRIAHMNGQTGKIGAGLPVSGWKVGLIIGIGALALIGIGVLMYKLFMGG